MKTLKNKEFLVSQRPKSFRKYFFFLLIFIFLPSSLAYEDSFGGMNISIDTNYGTHEDSFGGINLSVALDDQPIKIVSFGGMNVTLGFYGYRVLEEEAGEESVESSGMPSIVIAEPGIIFSILNIEVGKVNLIWLGLLALIILLTSKVSIDYIKRRKLQGKEISMEIKEKGFKEFYDEGKEKIRDGKEINKIKKGFNDFFKR